MPEKPTIPVDTPITWRDASGNAWKFTSRWGVVDGRLECVEAGIAPHEGPHPLTAAAWRAAPIAELIERSRVHVANQIQWLTDLSPEEAKAILDRGLGSPRSLKRARDVLDAPPALRALAEELRPTLAVDEGPARMTEAVRIYRAEWAAGNKRPTRAVAEALEMTPSAAAKLIYRARRAKLLPQTSQGKAGASSTGAGVGTA